MEEIIKGNPGNVADNDNGGEGEGVPVAEVIEEEVSVDGNLKVSEHNNKMSTWEATVRNLSIDFIFNVNFLWDLCLRVSAPIAW